MISHGDTESRRKQIHRIPVSSCLSGYVGRLSILRVALTMLLAAILSWPGLAQQASQDQTPTFRSSTRLVVTTVSVKGRDGRPIEGLTAKDFIVTEDNEPQEVPA